MTPAQVRTMSDSAIVEMLVSLRPSDQAVAWLASVIADEGMVAGVNELSRRYVAKRDGRHRLPRARNASSVMIDGAKWKQFFWSRRITLSEVGLMIGKSDGLGSVIAHKGRASFWTCDAIANELGLHVDAFLTQVGTSEELARLELV